MNNAELEKVLVQVLTEKFKIEKIEKIKDRIYFDKFSANIYKQENEIILNVKCDEWNLQRIYPIIDTLKLYKYIYNTILIGVYNNNIDKVKENENIISLF